MFEKILDKQIEKIVNDIPKIIKETLDKTELSQWYAYHCDNGCQKLDRLSFMFEEYEIQINSITHSVGAHCHGCYLLSLILDNGYGWFLQQHKSDVPIYQFSSPGSIITLNPNDTHWIPESNNKSLSLCVFTKQSDWHLYYCKHSPLSVENSSAMLVLAHEKLKQYFLEKPF